MPDLSTLITDNPIMPGTDVYAAGLDSAGDPAAIDLSAVAPINAQYLTAGPDGILTNERVLTAGDGITLTSGTGILTIAASVSGGLTVGTSAERLAASPATGDIWADTTISQTGFWNGSSWINISTWAALPTPITDAFTAADGTTLIGRTTDVGGKTWTALVSGSTGTITSNQGAIGGGTGSGHAIGLNTGVAGFTIAFKNVSSVSNAAAFVRHNGTNTTNGIRVQQVSGTWRWVKDNSVVQDSAIAVGTNQTLSIEVAGNVHTLTIGGASNVYTDAGSSYTSATYVGGYNGLVIDDLVITPS